MLYRRRPYKAQRRQTLLNLSSGWKTSIKPDSAGDNCDLVHRRKLRKLGKAGSADAYSHFVVSSRRAIRGSSS